jgi:hypothetical protein
MTKDGWKGLVIKAVREADAGNVEILDLLAQNLYEADWAKQVLRIKGYGWTGLSLLLTISTEVPSRFENEQEVQEFVQRMNANKTSTS